MYTVILLVLVVGAIVFFAALFDYYGFWEALFNSFCAAMMALVIVGVLVFCISIFQPSKITTRTETSSVRIYELSRGLGVEGDFYLGYGSVDSVVAYRYSTKLPNGNFKDLVVTEGQVSLERHPTPGIKEPHYKSVKVFERKSPKRPTKWLFNLDTEMVKSETWTFYYPPGTEYPFK